MALEQQVLIFVVGPPASGKGQIGRTLKKYYHVEWMRISNIFTHSTSEPIGYDDMCLAATSSVKEFIQSTKTHIYFDGFPRTEGQITECFAFSRLGFKVVMVQLFMPLSESRHRITSRRLCSSCLAMSYGSQQTCPKCNHQLLVRRDFSFSNTAHKVDSYRAFLKHWRKGRLRFGNLITFYHPYSVIDVVQGIASSACLVKRNFPLADDLEKLSHCWMIPCSNSLPTLSQ